MNSHRERIVALAACHALPASYGDRDAVVAGGLMSYGTSATDASCSPGYHLRQIAQARVLPTFPCRYATADETASL
jgi:putative ABC transport system substrate-binding protein